MQLDESEEVTPEPYSRSVSLPRQRPERVTLTEPVLWLGLLDARCSVPRRLGEVEECRAGEAEPG